MQESIAVEQDQTVRLVSHCVLIRRDGSESAIEDSTAPIHSRKGEVIGAVMVFHDVGEAQAMALKMTRLAQHDLLTGLPNRLLLNDRITQAISLSDRQGKRLAVLFLDLNGFKQVNDSLGHAIGDELLRSAAKRVVASVRSSDTVSRFGGDEFVVLLPEIADAGDAAITAEKILTALAKPYVISGHDLQLTGCFGISIYPQDGHYADTLIKNADTAMYQAKGKEPRGYRFFEKKINVLGIARQFLERSLGRALDRQEFLLHYQPKVDLETGTITGAEALIRWNDPERGLILPAQFVPFAEDCGLIAPIGQWVLREACRQTRAWMDVGLRPIPVAVNISAMQLRAKDFLESVCGVLADARLEPHYLELEFTESVLMRDDAFTISLLLALKALGVRLAVDDFGTGYSSLSYLRRFPIDTVKIDQSFMLELSTNGEGNPARPAMKPLSLRVLRIFREMRKDRLDLDVLFEATGNKPAERRRVLDAIDELTGAGMLEACSSDFYTLTERGKGAIAQPCVTNNACAYPRTALRTRQQEPVGNSR